MRVEYFGMDKDEIDQTVKNQPPDTRLETFTIVYVKVVTIVKQKVRFGV